MSANLENPAVATGLEKVSFHSNAKECSNYYAIALISQASNIMLKIVQARLQQYVNQELPVVQARFRKGRDISLSTKVHLVKAIVFQVVIYGCESWTVKKAEG